MNRTKTTLLVASLVLNVVIASDLYFSPSRKQLNENVRVLTIQKQNYSEALNSTLNLVTDLEFQLNVCKMLVKGNNEQ